MSERPKKTDDAILTAAAIRLAADFCKEWPSDFPPDKESMDILIEDLRDTLEQAFELDGYHLAKEMDAKGYDPDARMVEVLDRAYYCVDEELRKACETWVSESGIVPPDVGSRVTCAECEGVGQILNNHPDGRSTVCFADMGHSPKGPTRGRILEWEKLTPAKS